MVSSLANLNRTEGALQRFKIIAVLSETYQGPCAPRGKNLSDQGLRPSIHNWLGLYFPQGTTHMLTKYTKKVFQGVLSSQETDPFFSTGCLERTVIDLEETPQILEEEYLAQEELISLYGGN
jgi:tripartite-type tricarboxylate transporter receptor subunit TctC